jgi:hypothetical protein
MHYDGATWSPQTAPMPAVVPGKKRGSTTNFEYVWGAIVHYDGIKWSPQTSGTANFLRGVWGTSSSDVFAGGDRSTILHYNGTTWTPMTSGTNVPLTGVWGSSLCNVFVSGHHGTVLRYDGTNGIAELTGTTAGLMEPRGLPGIGVYAVGSGTDLQTAILRRGEP